MLVFVLVVSRCSIGRRVKVKEVEEEVQRNMSYY
jgi:hypothetical protein